MVSVFQISHHMTREKRKSMHVSQLRNEAEKPPRFFTQEEREREASTSIRPSSFLSLQHIRLKKTKQLVSPSLSTSKTESKGERREGGYNDLFCLQPCELPLTHSLHLLSKSFLIT
ncbi:hypothetical protein YC2023_042365 [Brassica napus]